MLYGSAVHKCCCGCGEKVVTPFSPTDWKLTFDGETVSLHPSIGNWSFKCRSHYWIRENQIHWAPQWSDEEIEAGRQSDRHIKQRFFAARRTKSERPSADATVERRTAPPGFWSSAWASVESALRSLWPKR
jgi:hypothetical protein